MRLTVNTSLVYDVPEPTPLLLLIEAATTVGQRIVSARLELPQAGGVTRIPAHNGIGERLWITVDGRLSLDYHAEVAIDRVSPDVATLAAVALHRLPADTIEYLMPSRYCPSDAFDAVVTEEFGGLRGGACISAICDWVTTRFTYAAGASTSATTAIESFARREGVCRDYAHVVIALARAAHIPARFASVYAPRVAPPDFHAVAEVYLDGGWRIVDATGMTTPGETAIIAVGRDAADVAFLGAFGRVDLVHQSVSVTAR